MSKVLILAKSGFGKTTSMCHIEDEANGVKIEGLDPKTTYYISVLNKPMPVKGYKKSYVLTSCDKYNEGNRIISNNATEIADIITKLAKSPYKNIVLDDMNYIAQDYYMKYATKPGWEVPKTIGFHTGLIFDAIDKIPEDKNIICMAHYEEYKDKNGDSISYKFKTTGKMVA